MRYCLARKPEVEVALPRLVQMEMEVKLPTKDSEKLFDLLEVLSIAGRGFSLGQAMDLNSEKVQRGFKIQTRELI